MIAQLSAKSHSHQGASIRAPSAPGFVPSHQLYPAKGSVHGKSAKVGMPLRHLIGYILSSTSLALSLMAIACLSTNNCSGSSTSTMICGTNAVYCYAVHITQCTVLTNCCSGPSFASKQVSHLANMATGLTTPTSLSCVSIAYIVLPQTPVQYHFDIVIWQSQVQAPKKDHHQIIQCVSTVLGPRGFRGLGQQGLYRLYYFLV